MVLEKETVFQSVNKNNVILTINQSEGSLKIQANKIDLTGTVTVYDLDSSLQTGISEEEQIIYIQSTSV